MQEGKEVEDLKKICYRYYIKEKSCDNCPLKINNTYDDECYFEMPPADWDIGYLKNVIKGEL